MKICFGAKWELEKLLSAHPPPLSCSQTTHSHLCIAPMRETVQFPYAAVWLGSSCSLACLKRPINRILPLSNSSFNSYAATCQELNDEEAPAAFKGFSVQLFLGALAKPEGDKPCTGFMTWKNSDLRRSLNDPHQSADATHQHQKPKSWKVRPSVCVCFCCGRRSSWVLVVFVFVVIAFK